MTTKNTLIITIEKGTDLFGAWAENVSGIYGEGETIDEVKTNIIESINLFKEYNENKNIPEILKHDFEIQWQIKS